MAVPEVSGTETVSVGRASVESVLLRCDSERPQPGTGDALYQQPKGTCVTKGDEVQGMKVASGYGVARGEADVKTKGRVKTRGRSFRLTLANTGTVLLSRPCQRDGSLGTPAAPPHLKCTIDLMEELHCEMSSVYRLRARTIEKLLHLRYGAGAGD